MPVVKTPLALALAAPLLLLVSGCVAPLACALDGLRPQTFSTFEWWEPGLVEGLPADAPVVIFDATDRGDDKIPFTHPRADASFGAGRYWLDEIGYEASLENATYSVRYDRWFGLKAVTPPGGDDRFLLDLFRTFARRALAVDSHQVERLGSALLASPRDDSFLGVVRSIERRAPVANVSALFETLHEDGGLRSASVGKLPFTGQGWTMALGLKQEARGEMAEAYSWTLSADAAGQARFDYETYGTARPSEQEVRRVLDDAYVELELGERAIGNYMFSQGSGCGQ